MATMEKIISLIEKLAGQRVPFPQYKAKLEAHDPFSHGGIGYNQLNELLLTLGYDRVTLAFFNYLFNEEPKVKSCEMLADGINKFRTHAMLLYGNIKFAFKTLSSYDKCALEKALQPIQPISSDEFKNRGVGGHIFTGCCSNVSFEEPQLLNFVKSNTDEIQ